MVNANSVQYSLPANAKLQAIIKDPVMAKHKSAMATREKFAATQNKFH